MAETPALGPITTWLVKLLEKGLEGTEIGVGDGIAPEEHGWPKGQPGVGLFQPYVVVKSLSVSPQRSQQPLGSSQAATWLVPYQLTGWGEVRNQADYVCDTVDAVVTAVQARTLRDDDAITVGFDVQQLELSPLGATQRDDKTSPQTWYRTDNLTIWLARAQPRRRG